MNSIGAKKKRQVNLFGFFDTPLAFAYPKALVKTIVDSKKAKTKATICLSPRFPSQHLGCS